MKVLILGVDCSLGRQLSTWLESRGQEVLGLTLSKCHWRSERQVKKVLRTLAADHVVDARMLALMELAQVPDDRQQERSGWVARSCHLKSMPLLFVSSARVFSGQLDRPYSEEDYPDGFSLLSAGLQGAEAAVRERCEKHIVLRLGAVHSADAGSLLANTVKKVTAQEIQVVCSREKEFSISDQDAARVISGVLDQVNVGAQNWGIFHYCGKEAATRFELCSSVIAQLEQLGALEKGTATLLRADKSAAALHLGLSCQKITDAFAIQQMPWSVAVEQWVKILHC